MMPSITNKNTFTPIGVIRVKIGVNNPAKIQVEKIRRSEF